jgi:hypothetical protein
MDPRRAMPNRPQIIQPLDAQIARAATHGRGAEAEISGHQAIVSAMAVGLVIDVWRNGPVEDMHCGKRGPDDAAMFAESTSLHDLAVTASVPATARPVPTRQNSRLWMSSTNRAIIASDVPGGSARVLSGPSCHSA